MGKLACSLLITDLDNTLWDWFEIWRVSFGALLAETMRISGLGQALLESEIRAVHQRHRTAEYAFVLEELPSLKQLHSEESIGSIYATALEARRAARHRACSLYPGVRESIEVIRSCGTRVVGYTESTAFYTSDRLRRTGLDDLLDVMYSAPDHLLPVGMTSAQLRRHPAAYYEHRRTIHRLTPAGALKPNAEILRTIVSEVGGELASTVYVGDSLMKDVAMAREAGVVDVWARYGESHAKEEYEQLRRVTHWTAEDVEREKALTRAHVSPSHVIDGFDQLQSLFRFESSRS